MTPEVANAFADLIHAWENREPLILAYFDHPVTNAYTESLNNLIRVMNPLGRGYSFEALWAKILFSDGVQNRIKPKFERRPSLASPNRRYEMFTVGSGENQHADGRQELNFGADISTLTRLIESHELSHRFNRKLRILKILQRRKPISVVRCTGFRFAPE